MSDREGLQERLAELIGRFFAAMGPQIAERLPLMELTMPQLRILLLLRFRGPLRISNIAAIFGVGMSTVSILVGKLEVKGLVARSHGAQDRRAVVCSLTPKGQREVEQFWRIRRERMEKITQLLGDDELQLVVKALEAILLAAQHFAEVENSAQC